MVAVQRSFRREQRRAETTGEIKDRAMEQIAAGGVAHLSLNAVARSMAMAPAALYRYFPNRDALLVELVVDAYDSLGDTLERAAAAAPPGPARLTAVAHAYRGWALARPNAYLLVFDQPSGNGEDLAPTRTRAAAERSMDAFLGALAELRPTGWLGSGETLAEQVVRWGRRARIPDLPADTLAVGLISWTRLHGLVSLELTGHLTAVGVDPGLLYDREVAAVLALTTTGAAAPPPEPT